VSYTVSHCYSHMPRCSFSWPQSFWPHATTKVLLLQCFATPSPPHTQACQITAVPAPSSSKQAAQHIAVTSREKARACSTAAPSGSP
jgi:hypothetical protein